MTDLASLIEPIEDKQSVEAWPRVELGWTDLQSVA